LCRSGRSGLSYSHMRNVMGSLALLVLLLVAGCGLAETGATAAAGASSEAQQAKDAKATEARMQQQINAAYQQDAARRKAAEAETQ
jgi:outer membrane biogenesis lipoprotein LolB